MIRLSKSLLTAVAAMGLMTAACGAPQQPPAAQPNGGSASVQTSTPSAPSQTSTPASAPQVQTVQVKMSILTDGKLNGNEQPKFTNPDWSQATGAIKVGNTVKLTIVSYDDGAAPPPQGFDTVKGTVGGVEQVDGKTVSSVNLKDISHTFSIPDLNINIPIPVAPTGGSVTVVASIPLTKAGTFTWQCFAPCGSGSSGWAGAMATSGWMRGNIKILS